MYFKFSLRYNKDKQQSDAYYDLVKGYCNTEGRVCHRTILAIDFVDDDDSPKQLNRTVKILTDKYEHRQGL